MEHRPLNDDGARTMRGLWFAFLDGMEPSISGLHGYALKLTGNVWDAEDLVQDTLLRGFAMVARGDFHGPDSPVRDARAYLFRTATNLWIDRVRQARRLVPGDPEEAPSAPQGDAVEVGEAVAQVAGQTSAREFAALVLKEACDFTLAEIADFLGTTPGTVKSLLSRGRGRLRNTAAVDHPRAMDRRLVDGFVAALNAGDADRVMALMAESVKIDVCNVGGGRGRRGIWTARTLARSRFEAAVVDGWPLALMFPADGAELCGALRFESDAGLVVRIIDYTYAPETLDYVAAQLGLPAQHRGRHQVDELPDMIATTTLPWQTFR